MPDIEVNSLVGLETNEPIVQMQWTDGSGLHKIQMRAEEALSLADNLVLCAEAGLSDLFLVTFLQERIGADRMAAVQVLGEFRAFRAERQAQIFAESDSDANGHGGAG